MPVDKKAIAALRRIVTPDRCRTDPETLTCYAYDATRQQAMPDAVVTPKTAEEVSAVMKLAYERGVPVYAICARKINEDVCVPRSRLLDSFRRIDEIGERAGFTIAKFGHAGEGNVHVNVLLADSEPATLERAERAVEAIFRAVIELGGTLTGEHGIGNTKSAYLHLECGPREIELMRQLKRLFDPKGLLNPGKIFPASVDG